MDKKPKFKIHMIIKDISCNKVILETSISYNDWSEIPSTGQVQVINGIKYTVIDQLHVPGCVHIKVEPINPA